LRAAKVRAGSRDERSGTVPTYVVLYKFTDQGARDIKARVQGTKDSKAEGERRGFTIRGVYFTQGRYDVVAVVDAPDEQAMMAGLFNIAEAGNARSETLRAFTVEEVEAAAQKR
jgi:uncharacterized protein with GYD domain